MELKLRQKYINCQTVHLKFESIYKSIILSVCTMLVVLPPVLNLWLFHEKFHFQLIPHFSFSFPFLQFFSLNKDFAKCIKLLFLKAVQSFNTIPLSKLPLLLFISSAGWETNFKFGIRRPNIFNYVFQIYIS